MEAGRLQGGLGRCGIAVFFTLPQPFHPPLRATFSRTNNILPGTKSGRHSAGDGKVEDPLCSLLDLAPLLSGLAKGHHLGTPEVR